ncbi:MAG: RNA polymerase sigma factor, partial [Planctomycetota bacterium]
MHRTQTPVAGHRAAHPSRRPGWSADFTTHAGDLPMEAQPTSTPIELLPVAQPLPAQDDRIDELLKLQTPAFHWAVRILGSSHDAEDVVQHAYLKALAHIPLSLTRETARPWFFRVVVNAAKDHLRAEARRKARTSQLVQVQSAAPAPAVPPSVAELSGDRLLETLHKCLNEIDEQDRLPIILCYEQGLTQQEAAELLRRPLGSISKCTHRGLEQLRQKMTRRGVLTAPEQILALLPRGAAPLPPALGQAVQELARRAAEGQPLSPAQPGGPGSP